MGSRQRGNNRVRINVCQVRRAVLTFQRVYQQRRQPVQARWACLPRLSAVNNGMPSVARMQLSISSTYSASRCAQRSDCNSASAVPGLISHSDVAP